MNTHELKKELITRRIALKGGLAGLAATLIPSHLMIGCDSSDPSPTSNTADQGGEDQAGERQDTMPEGGDSSSLAGAGSEPIDEPMAGASAGMEQDQDAGLGDLDMGGMTDEPDVGVSTDFPQRDVPPRPTLASLIPMIGPLLDANELGMKLPEGFSARVIARSREAVPGQEHIWHADPDGGATYPTEDGGWIYVSNAETSIIGGVSAIRFDAQGEVIDAYPILEFTSKNCAGGITPWHTWLSCEERSKGQVYECSPWGDRDAIVRPALGTFKHEAVAVDEINGHLYLTEDERDGRLYRFTADQEDALGRPDLNSGTLEVATVSETGQVTWTAIPDPEFTGETPTRDQVSTSTPFNGGEGIWYHQSVIYFSTKGDNHVWAYSIDRAELEIIYDGSDYLHGVDNLTVSCCGDVLVAEDGGDMRLVAILPNGELKTLMQLEGQDNSEITGPAFDPSGTRLYFSSQRGTTGLGNGGITYEITGPFHQLA